MACDRKIGPFDCCSVVQGDCLELMKQLPSFACECGDDVSGEGGIYHVAAGHKMSDIGVVTDPPYGISIGGSGRIGGSGVVQPKQYIPVDWDGEGLSREQWAEIKRISRQQVVFGYNHLADVLGACSNLLIWDKKVTNGWDDNFSDCEAAYSSIGGPAKVFRHLWMGALRASETSSDDRVHPTQKPIALMEWVVGRTDSETIVDPFTGSGSTLVAAKKLGRHFLGFEISEAYCQIARERLARIDAQPSLFEKKPEQLSL